MVQAVVYRIDDANEQQGARDVRAQGIAHQLTRLVEGALEIHRSYGEEALDDGQQPGPVVGVSDNEWRVVHRSGCPDVRPWLLRARVHQAGRVAQWPASVQWQGPTRRVCSDTRGA